MKKHEVEELIHHLQYQHTDRLCYVRDYLRHLPEERSLTTRMYMWQSFGNEYQRERFKERYSISNDCQVTSRFIVHYERTVDPSRNHAYAKDWLWGERDGKCIHLTTADTNKIVSAIDAILVRRGAD